MKNSRRFFTLVAALVMVFFFVGCATTLGKAAIKNVESIDFDLDLSISGEDYGFLWQKDLTIRSIDGKQDGNRLIFTPGQHRLEVQYIRGTSTAGGGYMQTQSDVVPILFNVEKGKTYFLNYEIINNRINFNITEGLTDPHGLEQIEKTKAELNNKIQKLKEYLVFSKKSPTYLVGTWYYENNYPPFNNTIIFQNDRFTITSFNRWGKSEMVTTGKYIFDNETIILFYEKKQGENISDKEILYYELKNNFLNILNAPQSVAILTIGSLKGQYHKTN